MRREEFSHFDVDNFYFKFFLFNWLLKMKCLFYMLQKVSDGLSSLVSVYQDPLLALREYSVEWRGASP